MFARISTVIAAYNAEQTIAQAVDSALEQQCNCHEVVVVDDCSRDSTLQILKSYGNRIKTIALPENRGPARARNLGVLESTGNYIAFLDSDDAWMPDKLNTMTAALERNSKASLAFSEYVNIGTDGAECGGSTLGHAPSMDEMLSIRPPIIPSTWVIPREAFQLTGGFCELFEGAGLEDSWLLIILREIGEFEYIEQRLTMYRTGNSSKIADKYGRGLSTFIDLVANRYGKAVGGKLIRNAKNLQCRWMLSKIAHQMNEGDRSGAVRTLASIAYLQPTYFLSSEFMGRLALAQNRKRLLAMAVAKYRSRKTSASQMPCP